MTDQEFLQHHGIKGMKWGVRRSRSQLRRERGELDSEMTRDERHAKLLKTTKASTLYKYRKELSNKELQERLNRIEMEGKLRKLSEKEKKSVGKTVDKALEYGKKANEFYNLYNSPMGKAAKSTIEKKVNKTK